MQSLHLEISIHELKSTFTTNVLHPAEMGFLCWFCVYLVLLQFGHRLEVIAKQPVSVLFGSQFKLSTYLLAVNEIETTVKVG